MDFVPARRGGGEANGRPPGPPRPILAPAALELGREPAPHRPDRALILARLLESSLFSEAVAADGLDAGWALEGMNRSLSLLQLFIALEQTRLAGRHGQVSYEVRYALSHSISRDFDSLNLPTAQEPFPTTDVLREIIVNLGRLFGPAIGNVAVLAAIPSLRISALKRRALVLLGANLMMSALLHSYRGRSTGKVLAGLHVLNGRQLQFDFEHDGTPPARIACEFEQDIITSLLAVLKADVVTRVTKLGHVKREFRFVA